VAPPSSPQRADEPIPELLRLGEQLAQARQDAGVSLEDLARRLRIEPRQLTALEQGDRAQLPGGVFVVALARRVAGVLHADLDEAIRAVQGSRLVGPELASGGRPAAVGAPSLASRAAAATAVIPPHAPAPTRPPAARPGRWPLAALVATCGLASVWLLAPRTPPRRPSPPDPSPSAAAPTPAQVTAPAPGQAPAPVDSLLLRASEPSWVEVREVDGRTLFEGTLTGEKRFPLRRGLEVVAGRPHAVRATLGQGTAVPLGGVADIRWKRFSPAGLSPAPPEPATSPR
jgi:cytoskeleton protein RodZ